MLDMFQLYRHKERLDEYRAVLLPTPPPTPSTAVQAHVPAATSNFSPNHDCSPPCSPAGSPTAVSDSVTPTPPAQGAVSKNGIISRVENMSMQVETFEKPSQTTSSWHQTPHSPVRSKIGITQTAMSSSGSATITTASTPLLQDTRNIHTSTASSNVMTKAKENPTHQSLDTAQSSQEAVEPGFISAPTQVSQFRIGNGSQNASILENSFITNTRETKEQAGNQECPVRSPSLPNQFFTAHAKIKKKTTNKSQGKKASGLANSFEIDLAKAGGAVSAANPANTFFAASSAAKDRTGNQDRLA